MVHEKEEGEIPEYTYIYNYVCVYGVARVNHGEALEQFKLRIFCLK